MKRAVIAGAIAGLAYAGLASPARALDLNAFRAQHKLPPLAMSGALSATAQEHARDLAQRQRLDHKNFRQRMDGVSSTAAENVAVIACARPDAKPVATFAGRACGCDSQSCAMQMWAKSAGHRRNMLMRGVSSYGIASATAENGRRYWVLVVGN